MSIQNLSKTFLSIVDQKLLNSSLIYSWYVRDSSITSMWTLHFTIFCLMKKYQTVYPNLYHSTYVSHMREKGVHYDGSAGEDLKVVNSSKHIWGVLSFLDGVTAGQNPELIYGKYVVSRKKKSEGYIFQWAKEKHILIPGMIYGAKLGKSSFSIIVQTGGGEKQSKQRNRRRLDWCTH